MNNINVLNINKYDALVIGSGFSGSIIANELASIGQKVLIIEKRSHIGGNMYDKKINDVLTHIYGPHILYMENDITYNFLSRFTEFTEYYHKVYANINGVLAPLPVNYITIQKCFGVNSNPLIELLVNEFGIGESITIHQLLNNKKTKEFGTWVFSNIFYDYSYKMWGIDPLLLDKFVLSRIPIRLSDNSNHFLSKYQYMPKHGYTLLFENMLSSKNIDIVFNKNANELLRIYNNKLIWIPDNKEIKVDVFYTGAIDELFQYKYGVLKYRSLNIKIDKIDKEFYQEYATINFPDKRPYTRTTDMKRLNCQNENTKNTIILTEYPGEFSLDSSEFNERYYPMPNKECEEAYNLYATEAKNITNLFLVGRLAEYKYINMETTILNALNFLENYHKNKKL